MNSESPLRTSSTVLLVACIVCGITASSFLLPRFAERDSSTVPSKIAANALQNSLIEFQTTHHSAAVQSPPKAVVSQLPLFATPTAKSSAPAAHRAALRVISATHESVNHETKLNSQRDPIRTISAERRIAQHSLQDDSAPQLYAPVTVHPVTVNIDNSGVIQEISRLNDRIDALRSEVRSTQQSEQVMKPFVADSHLSDDTSQLRLTVAKSTDSVLPERAKQTAVRSHTVAELPTTPASPPIQQPELKPTANRDSESPHKQAEFVDLKPLLVQTPNIEFEAVPALPISESAESSSPAFDLPTKATGVPTDIEFTTELLAVPEDLPEPVQEPDASVLFEMPEAPLAIEVPIFQQQATSKEHPAPEFPSIIEFSKECPQNTHPIAEFITTPHRDKLIPFASTPIHHNQTDPHNRADRMQQVSHVEGSPEQDRQSQTPRKNDGSLQFEVSFASAKATESIAGEVSIQSSEMPQIAALSAPSSQSAKRTTDPPFMNGKRQRIPAPPKQSSGMPADGIQRASHVTQIPVSPALQIDCRPCDAVQHSTTHKNHVHTPKPSPTLRRLRSWLPF